MTAPRVAALRVAAAGLLGAIAGIHVDLWASQGYRDIPTIGPLFLLNGVAGALLALGCVAARRRLLVFTAASSVLFAAGTLVALVLAINVGLFGFTESSHAPLFTPALAVEAAAVVTGALLGAVAYRRRPAAGPR